ncbi:sulfite exporter TauE/SafE family protein [Phenylobacterium sp. NIBR 498073]|uniref:sulfite exporter TauE/SafE family protein n=1 Tax=Phenylobacterium sp. NIBR 498073 TaxID=3015177 RepID=UPI0022B370FC|nr:sulfite exporter TauE/SafE family protein [Phenylobacterium sp. NIBR 498073]MBS0490361.1 sulfite exporter TauE/SafE family protein [Pseudomonadota bacterium]WGU40787.1 sulfite exporter TauE/SafE family protein [Phenylobacterium sp. NIBR 498073]
MGSELLLLGAGLLAGAMNALAGGGSFVTLPALIAAGVPSVAANASSTVALYPGGLASAWVYRQGLTQVCGVPIRPMLAVTLIGGLAGSLLLLWTPSSTFDVILPWLLLTATLALAFGPRLAPWLQRHAQIGPGPILALQFALGVYGGYFGGAVGLMMMAAWSLLAGVDLKQLNPPRTLMVSAANTVAVVCFAIAGAVRWPQALMVALGALAGGYLGAHLGRRLDPRVVRAATIALSVAMTAVFFVRAARG